MSNKPFIALKSIVFISVFLIILKLTGLTELEWYIVTIPSLILIICVMLYFLILLLILKALDLKTFLNKRKNNASK